MIRLMPQKHWSRIIALTVVMASGLQGCAGRPTTADCQSIADDDDRLACLDRAMYGDVAMGAGIGAVGGAALGAGLGGAFGGPRGAIMGGAAGAAGGATAGGIAGYLGSQQERTAGNTARMYSNVVAALRAKNGILESLVSDYARRLEKSEQQVTDLQVAMQQANNDSAEKSARENAIRQELAHTRAEVVRLTAEIAKSSDALSQFQQFFAAHGGGQESQEELVSLQKKISELEEFKAAAINRERQYDELICFYRTQDTRSCSPIESQTGS